jgi:hypothetical protein
MTDTIIFPVVGQAEFEWIESRQISGAQRPPIRGGVLSVEVECPACGEVWTARRGSGSGNFPPALGNGLSVDCPGCDVSGTIIRPRS